MLFGPDGKPIDEPEAPEQPAPKRPKRKRSRKPKTPAAPVTFGDTIRDRLEGTAKWLEPLGLGVHGSSFFFHWWKRLGLNWAIALCVTLFIPISQFSLLNLAMKYGVPKMFGDLGVVFEVGDWDLHLVGLRGTAHNVRISRDGRSEPVLTADEIEFNASFGALIGRLFGWPQTFDDIIVRDGTLRIERTLAGELNWVQFVDTVAPDRQNALAIGEYQTQGLKIDRLRIEYLEHIPASSGDGVIRSAQARIYIDDINGHVTALVAPTNQAELPTIYDLKGRTADGIVQISGRGAFFPPRGRSATGMLINTKLYLENIGLASYGRMVATTSLLPIRGTVGGTIEVRDTGGAPTCRSTLTADGVEFAPNSQTVLVRNQYDQLAGDLRGYRTSGAFNPCGDERTAGRLTATAVLASFNSQTTSSAPPAVRMAVARDENNFGLTLADSATADLTGKLAQEAARRVGSLVGGNTGDAVEKQGGNALTSGARSVGKGFKKLFGR